MMKLSVNDKSNTSLNANLLYDYLCKALNQADKITLVSGNKLCLEVDGKNKFETIQTISRYVATLDQTLNGSTPNEKTEVDSWLDFAQSLLNAGTQESFNSLATVLDSSLKNGGQYLVANRLTVADFSVYSALKTNKLFGEFKTAKNLPKYVSDLEKTFQNFTSKTKTNEKGKRLFKRGQIC